MSTIELTEQELTIRKRLIKALLRGSRYIIPIYWKKKMLLVRSLGTILERITRYDIENKQPILASIVILKSTSLPSEGFFELCDTLNIDDRLSDLQQECFEYWR